MLNTIKTSILTVILFFSFAIAFGQPIVVNDDYIDSLMFEVGEKNISSNEEAIGVIKRLKTIIEFQKDVIKSQDILIERQDELINEFDSICSRTRFIIPDEKELTKLSNALKGNDNIVLHLLYNSTNKDLVKSIETKLKSIGVKNKIVLEEKKNDRKILFKLE